MSLKQNQKGFGIIEVLLVLIFLSIRGFTGYYVWNSNRDKNTKAEPTNSEQAPKTATNDEQDPTAGWKEYKDVEGKFSFKYPASWVLPPNLDMCEGTFILLGPTEDTVGRCASDGGGMMSLQSFGAQMSGPEGLSEEYYDNITSEEVTLNGITGIRQAGTYTYSGEGIGPQPNSKEVRYLFTKDDLTYSASYTQQPGNPDVLKDFDLIVTKTLKFN